MCFGNHHLYSYSLSLLLKQWQMPAPWSSQVHMRSCLTQPGLTCPAWALGTSSRVWAIMFHGAADSASAPSLPSGLVTVCQGLEQPTATFLGSLPYGIGQGIPPRLSELPDHRYSPASLSASHQIVSFVKADPYLACLLLCP